MLDKYPRKLRTALASWLILAVGFWGTTATRGQCPATESAKLTGSDAAAADGFGVSVAVSGNVAVSGAWHDDDACPADPLCDSGAAYVYRFNGTDWIEEAKLTASDAQREDLVGFSVSVWDDVAVVGAPGDDDGGTDSGSAYVFRFDGANWWQQAKLTASDTGAFDHFGKFVSVSGDVAVIGAPNNDDAGTSSGSAYVYRFNGSDWIEEAKLTAADAELADFFGHSVSVNADVVVIGAPGHEDAGAQAGAAYVYRFDGTKWIEEAELIASDAAKGDNFGHSVSIGGELAVIGAVADDSAYVYRFDGANWVEEAKLTASDGVGRDGFGKSVFIADDLTVIGAPAEDDGGSQAGAAYAFRFDGIGWIQERKLTASKGALGNAAGDYLGWSVSVSADVAVIGARFDSDTGTGTGAAYVFDCRPVEGRTIIPISQLRFTNASVSFENCDEVSDAEQAVGFGPFGSAVEAALNCEGPYAHMSATQQSQIDATSMTATGGLFFKVTGFEGDPVFLLAGADSVFQVTFGLPSAGTFVLDGLITADGFGPAADFGTHAEITLTGPGGRTIFTHLVSVTPGGKHVTEKLGDAGELEPGEYTLRAEAGAGIDDIVLSSGVGDASFDFTLDVQEIVAGDLDGDGDVDLTDFELFLLCVGGPDAPPAKTCPPDVIADLDGDGDVDRADFAVFQIAFTEQ